VSDEGRTKLSLIVAHFDDTLYNPQVVLSRKVRWTSAIFFLFLFLTPQLLKETFEPPPLVASKSFLKDTSSMKDSPTLSQRKISMQRKKDKS
jgi:hypothetical protein